MKDLKILMLTLILRNIAICTLKNICLGNAMEIVHTLIQLTMLFMTVKSTKSSTTYLNTMTLLIKKKHSLRMSSMRLLIKKLSNLRTSYLIYLKILLKSQLFNLYLSLKLSQ